MTSSMKFFVVLSLFMSANVSASLMSFETRNLDRSGTGFTIDKNDLINSWHNQTSLIVQKKITEFGRIQSGGYTFSHIKINLDLDSSNNTWQFNLGLDAGFGASVYVDNKLVSQRTDDLWWRNRWSDSDVFDVSIKNLTNNNKFIDIYWAENCCNGTSSIRFKHNDSDWKMLSNANLAIANNDNSTTTTIPVTVATTVKIPEPSSLALMALSLLLLGSRFRTKNG